MKEDRLPKRLTKQILKDNTSVQRVETIDLIQSTYILCEFRIVERKELLIKMYFIKFVY